MDAIEQRRKAWIAGLRGNFKQTQGVLKRQCADGTFAYCCLGVYNELNHPDGFHYDQTEGAFQHDGCNYLSAEQRAELELDYSEVKILANMNDGGISFTAIADYLEEKWGYE